MRRGRWRAGALGSIFAGAAKGGKEDMPGKLLFISAVNEYLRAQAAMVKAHKSQMLWFRLGGVRVTGISLIPRLILLV